MCLSRERVTRVRCNTEDGKILCEIFRRWQLRRTHVNTRFQREKKFEFFIAGPWSPYGHLVDSLLERFSRTGGSEPFLAFWRLNAPHSYFTQQIPTLSARIVAIFRKGTCLVNFLVPVRVHNSYFKTKIWPLISRLVCCAYLKNKLSSRESRLP